MSRKPLTADAITSALEQLSGWRYESDQLCKDVALSDFREAVAVMVRIAFEAEQRDHHPVMTNVYNRLSIKLNTHDAGHKVTALDVDLAGAIDRILGE